MPRGRPPSPDGQRAIGRRNGLRQPVVSRKLKQAGIDPKVTPANVVDHYLQDSVDLKQKLRGRGVESVPESYAEAQTMLERLKVAEKQLKLEILEGTLVDREEVNRLFFDLGKPSREVWEQWPPRVSAEMARRLGVKAHDLETVLTEFVAANLQATKSTVRLQLRGDAAAA
jgi:hypothetical protein